MRRRTTRQLTKINTETNRNDQTSSPEKRRTRSSLRSQTTSNDSMSPRQPYIETTEREESSGKKSPEPDETHTNTETNVEVETAEQEQSEAKQSDKMEMNEIQGKGKSKNKTGCENNLFGECVQPTNSQISETVQVTDQSPSIDIAVVNQSQSDDKTDSVGVSTDTPTVYKTDRNEDVNENCINGDGNNSKSEEKPLEIASNNADNEVKPRKEEETDSNSKQVKRIRLRRTMSTAVDNKSSTYEVANTADKITSVTSTEAAKIETTPGAGAGATDVVDSSKSLPVDGTGTAVTDLSRTSPADNLPATPDKVSRSKSTSDDVGLQKTTPERVHRSKSTPCVEKSEVAKEEQPIREPAPKIKIIRDRYMSSGTTAQEKQENEESNENKPNGEEFKVKEKQYWWISNENLPMHKIDFSVVREMCVDVEILDEKDVKLDPIEERRRPSLEKRSERKVSVEYTEDSSERPDYKKQVSVNSTDDTETNLIAFNRKISIVDDSASKLRPPPEPAKNPVSEVLYITNLVRPFTLKQLKELLGRTGKIVEDGFWTDRIKSKCYAQYETQEEAEATRNALHGVTWPIGNGKQLMIEYATVDDLERARNPPVSTTPPVEKRIDLLIPEKGKEPIRGRTPEGERRPPSTREEHPSGVRVREWDIGKENVHRRSLSGSRHRHRSKERDRSKHGERSRERRSKEKDYGKHKRTPSPGRDHESRTKHRRIEPVDDVPQKLMDDLFLKTKAIPSIYWQPLSPEEIATKQQQRLMRMEEHKRRMEVNASKNRGGRENSGRGAMYRRR